ncbi:MAG: transcriptional repressor NrdR [Firmicutes bacterium]|nr:transcriptional repressor NrdR [Bacillota bacterium]
MRCPFCGNIDTKVIDTRSMEDNSAIRRRRVCEKCNERFTTYERVDTIPITVIKSDNTRECFDRSKLLKGVIMSCNKRPVSLEQIEDMVSDIETAVINSMRKEISSQELGGMVMDRLKDIDDVAYVRFASVYRKFQDIDSFMVELGKLLNDRKSLQ